MRPHSPAAAAGSATAIGGGSETGFYRCGHSTVLVRRSASLPPPGPARDRALLSSWHAGAPADVDGALPGGKILLLGRGTGTWADPVATRFGQLMPGAAAIEWRGRCGSALAAAALYVAAEGGGGHTAGPPRTIVLHEADGWLRAMVEVPPAAGGAPRRVRARFGPPIVPADPLPTGAPRCVLEPAGGPVECCLLHAGNPYVLLCERDADRLAAGDEIDAAARFAEVRRLAARRFGLPADSVFPKLALIGPATAAPVPTVVSRMMTLPGCWHPGYALTGLIALAAAAALPGSPLHDALGTRGPLTRLRVVAPARTFDLALGPSRRRSGLDLPEWVTVDQQVHAYGGGRW